MSSILDIHAGSRAFEHIKENGLSQEHIDMVLGASGGPKWFVLSGIDKALLSDFFRDRTKPLKLLGTSSGCWRFACYSQSDALAAHKRLEQGYLHQDYASHPTPEEISSKAWALLDDMLPEQAEQEILSHPFMRLNLISARSHGLCRFEKKPVQIAGLGLAALLNLGSRKLLKPFFSRTLFHHPDSEPLSFEHGVFSTEQVALSETNLKKAVMASGSIPLVMEGITDISGATKGVYRDGGITDYHFDMTFDGGDGLILYPHFYSRIIPGWFDKKLKWRQPLAANCENLVLISPSAEFVSQLPYGKIPDRKDFSWLDYKERVIYWKKVITASEKLGDGFLELLSSGEIRKMVRPLF